MDDAQIHTKLDKLARIEANNKARIARFLAKQKAQGKRQINAMIDGKAYEIICNERDKSIKNNAPLSAADIIEHALYTTYLKNVHSDAVKNIPTNAPVIESQSTPLIKTSVLNQKEPHHTTKPIRALDKAHTHSDSVLDDKIRTLWTGFVLSAEALKGLSIEDKSIYMQRLIQTRDQCKLDGYTFSVITEAMNKFGILSVSGKIIQKFNMAKWGK